MKAIVLCHNEEFEDYDEYVYSIRKTTAYDYNERFIVLIPPFKTMNFKIALKVPNAKETKFLNGSINVCV